MELRTAHGDRVLTELSENGFIRGTFIEVTDPARQWRITYSPWSWTIMGKWAYKGEAAWPKDDPFGLDLLPLAGAFV
jgi:hypothetical protein